MRFAMTDYIQSVMVQGRVYIGGGSASAKHNFVMHMKYTSIPTNWEELPPYQVWNFGMTVIDNQLVLVGGEDGVRYSKVLGVWGADSREWIHPYPEMPTARSKCSAVVYKEWLIVAGGVSNVWRAGLSVEVMNSGAKHL